jgi:hypothetical protein
MELVRNLMTKRGQSNLELSAREALEQIVAFLEYQRVNYERLPAEQRRGHIWEAVCRLKELRAHWERSKLAPMGTTEERKAEEALRQVVTHLQYQQDEYERFCAEQKFDCERKGHIWEAVKVLKRELAQEVKHEHKRQVNGPAQNY